MDNKIIVIDDDLDFLEILKGHLLNSGFKNIRTEDNSLNVASLFEKGEDFDIALIDMTMPDMDGLDLLDIIKNISPRTECIMVTAVNEARIAVDCLKKGAYDYLVKPVSQEDLIFFKNGYPFIFLFFFLSDPCKKNDSWIFWILEKARPFRGLKTPNHLIRFLRDLLKY